MMSDHSTYNRCPICHDAWSLSTQQVSHLSWCLIIHHTTGVPVVMMPDHSSHTRSPICHDAWSFNTPWVSQLSWCLIVQYTTGVPVVMMTDHSPHNRCSTCYDVGHLMQIWCYIHCGVACLILLLDDLSLTCHGWLCSLTLFVLFIWVTLLWVTWVEVLI